MPHKAESPSDNPTARTDNNPDQQFLHDNFFQVMRINSADGKTPDNNC